jgi:type II secretory pathway component GspD/PulD (secretin)
VQTKQELYVLGLAALGLLAVGSNTTAYAGTGTLPALKTNIPAAMANAVANSISIRDIASFENGTRIVVESSHPFSPRVQTVSRPTATLITIPGLWDGEGARYTNIRQNGVYNVRTGISQENGRNTVRLVANSRQRLASSVQASPDKKRWVITLWKPGYSPSTESVAAAEAAVVRVAPDKVRTLLDRRINAPVAVAPVVAKNAPSIVVTALNEKPVTAPVVLPGKRSVAVKQKVTNRAAAPRAAFAPTFTAGSAAPGSQRVSLDFVSADISEVIKALAIQSGINIILATNGGSAGGGTSSSGAIQDKITVSLKRVSFAEALDTVVNLSGYRYARIGDTYAVGPPEAVAALARGSSVGIQTSASIPFIFSEGNSLKASIESAFPTLKGRISVVTIGSEGKMGGTIPLNSAASTSANGASTTDATAGGASAQNSNGTFNRVIPKGGVINVSASPAEIDAVRAYIDATEVALTEAPYREQVAQSKRFAGLTTEVYKIKYASAPDLIQVLQQLVANVYVTPGPTPGFKPNSTGQSLSYTASAVPVGGGVVLPPATATGGPATTSVTVTNNTTTLLLTGLPEDLARAQDVLGKIDIKIPQMVYETKVMDINSQDALKLGMTYDFSRPVNIGETNTPVPGTNGVGPVANIIDNPAKQQLANGFGALYRTPYSVLTQLQATINNNKGKVLSNPNLSALDGQTATVFVGDQIKYVTNIQQTQQGQNVTTETATVGITLKVTGRYSPDGNITLYVHPEVSSITSFLNVGNGIQLPQISTRFVDTTIRVKDGETIAIGGLINDTEVKNLQKVPFLGDIPFFGELFKYRQNTKNRSEIVVLLTSRLIKD